jgi:hypothetical protein
MKKPYAYAIYILWFIGIITIIFIMYEYFRVDNNVSLLSAFGILISAFLASVTMARSYDQNERFKTEEKNNNEFEIKKFAILAALDIFYSYYKQDDSLKVLKEVKHEYANRIERSSELLKKIYNDLYLAIELLYEDPEEPIITEVAAANNRIIEKAKSLNITHPFKTIQK